MTGQQTYDPFNNMVISTTLAATPVVVMLVCLVGLSASLHAYVWPFTLMVVH